jgi:hypothetical protein
LVTRMTIDNVGKVGFFNTAGVMTSLFNPPRHGANCRSPVAEQERALGLSLRTRQTVPSL